MTVTAKDILSQKGTPGIAQYVGETITIVSFEFAEGQFGEFAKITAVTAEGDEVVFQTGAGAVLGKLSALAAAELLPCECKVTSFPGQYGKDGYDIQPAEE